MAGHHSVHVVGAGLGWWRVTRTGGVKPSHRTHRRAVEEGTTSVRRGRGVPVVRGRSGRCRPKGSYGRQGRARDREH
jgi:hypothetical protein